MTADRPAGLPDETALLPDGVRIRTAAPDDRLDVARVLDGAMLQTEAIPERIEADDVLVAVAERGDESEDSPAAQAEEPVLGAAVLETHGGARHLDAVAVRRPRRDRGIGSALVARAIRDAREEAGVSRFTAEFDPDLRAFYAGLGFDVEPVNAADAGDDPDRLRGTLLV